MICWGVSETIVTTQAVQWDSTCKDHCWRDSETWFATAPLILILQDKKMEAKMTKVESSLYAMLNELEKNQDVSFDMIQSDKDTLVHAILSRFNLPAEVNLRSILAQGYCTQRNSKKVLDPDLIEDMAKALEEARKE